jgi:hypothetical protein
MSESVIIPERIGRRLTCNCTYTWVYAGKSERFATCPHCHSTVTIEHKNRRNRLTAAGGSVTEK